MSVDRGQFIHDRVVVLLKNAGKDGITVSEMRRALKRHSVTDEEVLTVIENLERSYHIGYSRWEGNNRGLLGRPTNRYRYVV